MSETEIAICICISFAGGLVIGMMVEAGARAAARRRS